VTALPARVKRTPGQSPAVLQNGVASERLSSGAAVFDPINDRAFVGAERSLEAGQPFVDALPARDDQVDEQGEVVHACVAFGEQVCVKPLEPSDGVRGQAAHFREMSRDRQNLFAETGLNGLADAVREGRLEVCRRLGQGLDLVAGPLERGLDNRRLGSPFGGLPQTLVRPLDCEWIHGPQR
jgi:hypothetical protein